MKYISEEIIRTAFLSLSGIWPYLLITIPLAVAVEVSGASAYIRTAFNRRGWLAVPLAAAVGAFSPFCSCGVIPVVFSLLKTGVPLAPVMAFWIASPSMDPEMFFLSVATLGWNLAIWRLASTCLLSLGAGYLTLYLWKSGFLGSEILKETNRVSQAGQDSACGTGCAERPSLRRRVVREAIKASWMVARFMLLAFLLTALINAFIPQELIARIMGSKGQGGIIFAGLLGVPFYTSNLAALPLVSGLLHQGMAPAAALAFLIAGPTTTLPAMTAVWGLTTRKIFFLYVSFSLIGSWIFGHLYMLVNTVFVPL
jgi:uncharacterized membrane protein YraQ (UPF0718 family)